VEVAYLDARSRLFGFPVGVLLGVELDHQALDRKHRPHRLHRESAVRTRDDTGRTRRIDPTHELWLPRW
jgi:hypothetical protein